MFLPPPPQLGENSLYLPLGIRQCTISLTGLYCSLPKVFKLMGKKVLKTSAKRVKIVKNYQNSQ